MSYKRDKAIANEVLDTSGLMCSAHGCPNRWSIDSADKGIGRLCSAHAWVDPMRWPMVTQECLDALSERAVRVDEPTTKKLTYAERVDALTRLREIGLLTKRDPKEWARGLQRREARGDRLTSAQRAMWRAAIPLTTSTTGELP